MAKQKNYPALDKRSVSERLSRGFREMDKYENGEKENSSNGTSFHHHLNILDEQDLAEESPLFSKEEIALFPQLEG